jgi:hypothetical protein
MMAHDDGREEGWQYGGWRRVDVIPAKAGIHHH